VSKKIARFAVPCLVLLFLYVPILILALYSFTDATQIGAIRAFTMKNYVTLFTTEELRDMIFGTILLALGSALLATILGTLGAIGSFYSKKRTSGAFATVNQIPVINADVVTGFSLCILLVVVFGIGKDSFVPLVVGHVTLCAPFVYLSVIPKLKQMDSSLYEAEGGAAADLLRHDLRLFPGCDAVAGRLLHRHLHQTRYFRYHQHLRRQRDQRFPDRYQDRAVGAVHADLRPGDPDRRGDERERQP